MRTPARRRTVPTTGGTAPMIVRRRVVLPEPDGPTTPTNSPGATARSTLTRTGSEPYRHVTRSSRTRSPPASLIRRSLRIDRLVGGDVAGGEGLERGGVAAQRFHHRHVVEAHQADPGVLRIA